MRTTSVTFGCPASCLSSDLHGDYARWRARVSEHEFVRFGIPCWAETNGTSEEPASLQAGKPVLGIPGVLNAGRACASSVLARTACSRRLARAGCAAGADAAKELGAVAWSIPKAEMGVMPSSATSVVRAKLAVLVMAAGAGLRTREDGASGAEAKAERRLGAMVMVMVFSLSDVNRRQ